MQRSFAGYFYLSFQEEYEIIYFILYLKRTTFVKKLCKVNYNSLKRNDFYFHLVFKLLKVLGNIIEIALNYPSSTVYTRTIAKQGRVIRLSKKPFSFNKETVG